MAFRAVLAPGQTVAAAVDFGPVIEGQLGIVLARQRRGWRPWRPVHYRCMFLGGTTVAALAQQITPLDHGYSLLMLRDPWWFLHTRTAAAADRPVEAARRSVA